jgi:Undecaprenyl-phosphate galactose phosphotransferase WbaP
MGTSSVVATRTYPLVLDHPLNRWLTYGSILLADLIAVSAAGFFAVLTRYLFHAQFLLSDWITFAPAVFIFIVVFAFSGLYPGIGGSPTDEFRIVLRASTISFFILIAISFFLQTSLRFSRIVFCLAWILTLLLVPVSRRLVRGLCSDKPWWGIPTVILGECEAGVHMLSLLKGHPRLGLRPVALLLERDGENGDRSSRSNMPSDVIVGNVAQAGTVGMLYPGAYALIAMPKAGSEALRRIVSQHLAGYKNVLIVPDLFGIRSLSVSAKDICGVLTLKLDQRLGSFWPQFCKRSFDVTVSLMITALLSPLLLLICLAVKVSSKGPIFYGQLRVGKNNRPFRVWKFRSMLVGADDVLKSHLEANLELKKEWESDHKLKQDPRVTRIGSFLRKSSLDELPQLWNVICGEMSLVGPRPIVNAEVVKYGDCFDQYQLVTPGVTGLWQVSGRNNTTYELRTRIDDYYVRNWSLSLDTYILLRTVKTIVFSEGAY